LVFAIGLIFMFSLLFS